MERNFFRRIEVAFAIERKQHRERIIEDLETYLADNTQAWELTSDGTYVRVTPDNAPPVNAQAALMRRYSEASA
jgi:polyphosphate kinase